MNDFFSQKIGVVIPFYNGDEFILKCIESLQKSLLPESFTLQIFITDNNKNKSRYKEKIQQQKNITYLKTKPAIGYGRACNVGAQRAIEIGCEYLCFLNQDTIVDEEMMVNVLEVLTSQSELTVCSPMIFNYDFESPMEMVVVDYLLKNKEFLNDTYSQKRKAFYEIPTIGAACTIMRSSVIEKIGLYDPLLYLYGEDYDFFKRLKRIGGRLLVVTEAKLAHRASMNETDLQKKWSNKLCYEEAQLIKFIRYDKKEGYLKKTVKGAWVFLLNSKLKLLGIYLTKAMKIYINSAKFKLPSDEAIKKRMIEYQKKDVVL